MRKNDKRHTHDEGMYEFFCNWAYRWRTYKPYGRRTIRIYMWSLLVTKGSSTSTAQPKHVFNYKFTTKCFSTTCTWHDVKCVVCQRNPGIPYICSAYYVFNSLCFYVLNCPRLWWGWRFYRPKSEEKILTSRGHYIFGILIRLMYDIMF